MPWTLLHQAGYRGCVHDVRGLLGRHGVESARVRGILDQAPLHVAAARGHAGMVQLLVEAAPDVAVARDRNGQLPLHHAAGSQQPAAEVVQLLLGAAPGSAAEADALGSTPLHLAARHNGDVGVMQQLLADAPATVAAADAFAELPLHLAARNGHAGGVRVLLTACPELATAQNGYGLSPLACTVMAAGNVIGRTATLQLLLMAAPAMATAVDGNGSTPLHIAVQSSAPEVIVQLLAAAPDAALMSDRWGCLPLHHALRRPHTASALEAARHLLMVGSTQQLLPALVSAGQWACPLFATLASRAPMAEEEWQVVPSECPGLASALPAVLMRSEQEAGQLVRRLPAADRRRLRTFALSLGRAQQQLGVQLPPPILRFILALFDRQAVLELCRTWHAPSPVR